MKKKERKNTEKQQQKCLEGPEESKRRLDNRYSEQGD